MRIPAGSGGCWVWQRTQGSVSSRGACSYPAPRGFVFSGAWDLQSPWLENQASALCWRETCSGHSCACPDGSGPCTPASCQASGSKPQTVLIKGLGWWGGTGGMTTKSVPLPSLWACQLLKLLAFMSLTTSHPNKNKDQLSTPHQGHSSEIPSSNPGLGTR